jgi:ribosomal protein L29
MMKLAVEDLRKLDIEELEKRIREMKKEKLLLRQQKNSGDAKPEDLMTASKNYAKLLHVRREKIILETYKDVPIDKLPKKLRPRRNKALRQRISDRLLNRKTYKQKKRAAGYRKIIFAYKE